MLNWADGPVTVRVPATSANLGPGFDSLGLALSLYDTVQARVAPAGLEVRVTGVGASGVGVGEEHLVVRAMRAGFAAIGAQPSGLALDCRNEVPQGFGLGSSAAAIVAGLVAARSLAGATGAAALPPDELLRLAAELEGHPDNVAACLSGGLSISWTTTAGVRAARLTPLPELEPVLCVPAVPLATVTARQVLPAEVPHALAAANSARAALLIAALTARPELLLDGTEDFLHQPYRAAAMPETTALITRLRAVSIAAVVSGAGPSVLALTVRGAGPAAADVAQIAGRDGVPWQVLALAVDADGARAHSG
jgi:homoserine kinase